MNKLPLITIVTVSYNAALTIESTILSVVNQTYSNIEYIIIDGGSIDGTVDIVKKYNHKIAFWISESDNGIYDAMNKSINFLKGDWILFLGADDVLYSTDVINEVSRNLKNSNTVYYGNALFYPSKTFYGGKFNQFSIVSRNFCHQTIFYPKIVFDKYHYETKYRVYADYNLNITCFGDNEIAFQYMNLIIVQFSEQGTSAKMRDEEFENDFYRIISKKLGKCYSLYAFCKLSIYHFMKKVNESI